MVTLRISRELASEIARVLSHEAYLLRRRHPSDGLFQNRYTADQCREFKRRADRFDGVVNDLATLQEDQDNE